MKCGEKIFDPMKEDVRNMKEYVKNMKEYVGNMKKQVENMKEYVMRSEKTQLTSKILKKLCIYANSYEFQQ